MKTEIKEIIKKIIQDCVWLLIVFIIIFQLWISNPKIRKNSPLTLKNLATVRITNQNDAVKTAESKNPDLLF